MKVQCDGCERAEAVIVCCADEAALCRECDIRVHDANKLASKHQRVPLFRPATSTHCDICQEKVAYFFCLEDRALLCHTCDVSIHKLARSTLNHRRFLITGVAASLHTLSGQPPETPTRPSAPPPVSSQRKTKQSPGLKRPQPPPPQPQKQQNQIKPQQQVEVAVPVAWSPTVSQAKFQREVVPSCSSTVTTSSESSQDFNTSRKTSIFEFLTEGVPGWKCDDLLNSVSTSAGDFIPHHLQPESTTISPFKVDQTNPCSTSEQFYSRSVPQLISPLPTGAGRLHPETSWSWMKPRSSTKQQQEDIISLPEADDAFVVPDLGLHSAPELPPVMKKRRFTTSYFSELDNIFLS